MPIETIPLGAVLRGSASWSELLSSELPVQAVLEERAGHALTTFVLLSMALAILNANIAFALWSGRMLFAAARNKALPEVLARPLSRVQKRAHMPVAATVVMGGLSGLCWLLPLQIIADRIIGHDAAMEVMAAIAGGLGCPVSGRVWTS